MKKVFYIIGFGFLGLLISTIVHGVVELIALELVFGDAANANTFWWQEWQLIHAVGAGVLWFAGLLFGLFAGYIFYDEYGNKPGAFGWGK